MQSPEKFDPRTEILTGYKFPFLRFVPNNLDKSKPIRIVVWCHGSINGDVMQSLSTTPGLNYPTFIAQETNSVLLTPAIPRQSNSDAQIMERSCLFDESVVPEFYRPDLEVVRAIQDTTAEMIEKGFAIEEKSVIGGFSAGANLSNRLSVMHPKLFSHVCLLSGGTFMYPDTEVNNLRLPYPLGTADLGEIGITPNLDAFMQIKHSVYVGEDDTNPGPISYELRDNPELLESYQTNFGKLPTVKTRNFIAHLQAIGVEVTEVVGENQAHSVGNIEINKLLDFIEKEA